MLCQTPQLGFIILNAKFFQSTVIVSLLTLLSRLLGFVRDMLIARTLGVELATDAFFIAFKVPNLFRRLFVEGAFAHAFIPVLADYQAAGDKIQVQTFMANSAGALVLLMTLVSLIGMVIAPLLIWVLAPGFAIQVELRELTAVLLQWCMPYLLFVTLVAWAGSVLNAHGHFAMPAFTPALLNIVMIITMLVVMPSSSQPVTLLAASVSVAGLLQLIVQLPLLARLNLLRVRFDFKHPGVRRFFSLLLPTIFSVSVTQINLLLDTLVASLLSPGSVSWLYYSDRLVEFPLAVLGMALAAVILPNLAKHHAANDVLAFQQALNAGVRMVWLLALPATAGLIVLAKPVLTTLFQYHEFTIHDVNQTSQSLIAYALGLPAYMLIKVLIPGFTSRQQNSLLVRYGIYAMLVSLFGNVLAIPFAHAGLALATSLGAWCNAGLLLRKLHQDKLLSMGKHEWVFFVRLGLAVFVMVAVLVNYVDATMWFTWSAWTRIAWLAFWVGVTMLLYGASLLSLGFKKRDMGLH